MLNEAAHSVSLEWNLGDGSLTTSVVIHNLGTCEHRNTRWQVKKNEEGKAQPGFAARNDRQ